MKIRLLVALVSAIVAAFICGGNAFAQSNLDIAKAKIAVILARAEVLKARDAVAGCRPAFLNEEPAPSPQVAVAPQPMQEQRAIVAPVEKPKAVEQARIQAPVKLQQPLVAAAPLPIQSAQPAKAAVPQKPPMQVASVPPAKPATPPSQDGITVSALKIPTERDVMIRGVKYARGTSLWAIIRETKDGKLVDKDGQPTKDPEITNASPRGAKIVSQL